MNTTEAQAIIQKWRRNLNLQHWEFGISTQTPVVDSHDMEIVMTPTRQHAAIRIHPRCYTYSYQKFEKLIIHEMLHPLFDPLVRAYGRVVDERQFEEALFDERIEIAVDHIAKILYNVTAPS